MSWNRPSMWDRSIELGSPDRWVLTSRPRWMIGHWLEGGLTRVPEEKLFLSIHAALAQTRDKDVARLWCQLFEYPYGPVPTSVDEFARELLHAACGPIPRVIVLERLVERGFRSEPLVWVPRPLPPRTPTDHFVVVQAIDTEGRPVSGLHLEVLIADGEIKSARTDAEGFARVERVQAGRVVIRVLSVDGARWRPLSGPPADPSGVRTGPRWHVVRQGECLSRIAHQYGLESWQRVWEHPKNEALRRRRKSPHVLHPGDELVVAGIEIHEIVRPTDATHRIEVNARDLVPLRVHLRSSGESSCGEVAWSLFDPGDRSVAVARGRTDAEGQLRALVPVTTTTLLLVTEEPEMAWQLQLGGLTEAREHRERDGAPLVRGIQGRLLGLGFDCGAMDGVHGPRTSAALAAFHEQVMSRSATAGELDAETVDRLVQEYEV